MRTLRWIALYLVLPLAIVGLLYLNGQIASDKYGVSPPEEGQYLAEITAADSALTAKAGEEISVPVTLRNAGSLAWFFQKGKNGSVSLSYHIKTESGDPVGEEGERTALPRTVAPGEEVSVDLSVSAPDQPGSYLLEIDMVCEGVTWFADQGSEILKLRMDVTD